MPANKRLNFGAIWITAPCPDPDPYRDTGKTCLGGGMHCPSASSLIFALVVTFEGILSYSQDVSVYKDKCLIHIYNTHNLGLKIRRKIPTPKNRRQNSSTRYCRTSKKRSLRLILYKTAVLSERSERISSVNKWLSKKIVYYSVFDD